MQVSDVQGPVLTICQSWPGGPRKPSLIVTRGVRACQTETSDFAIWVEFRGFNAIFAIPWAKFDGFLVPHCLAIPWAQVEGLDRSSFPDKRS